MEIRFFARKEIFKGVFPVLDYYFGKRRLVFSLNKMKLNISLLGYIEYLGVLSVNEGLVYEKENTIITTIIATTDDAS